MDFARHPLALFFLRGKQPPGMLPVNGHDPPL
jgi:hypothetical protein